MVDRIYSVARRYVPRKPLYFVGPSRKELRTLPEVVQSVFGAWLLDVQYGETPRAAKLLKGVGDARVLELVQDHDTNTYRAVYTVQFVDAVYALHFFQKKATRGIATPQHALDLVRQRYRLARHHYQVKYPNVSDGKKPHA